MGYKFCFIGFQMYFSSLSDNYIIMSKFLGYFLLVHFQQLLQSNVSIYICLRNLYILLQTKQARERCSNLVASSSTEFHFVTSENNHIKKYWHKPQS